jgi:23S rRNA (adenine2030-N6)-methyltransferase
LLSYRHAFHAGNHADVLKHLVLVHVLDYLVGKDKPLWYVDTHAGAGRYALDSGPPAVHAEHLEGVQRIWDAATLPPALARYRERVAGFNRGGRLRCYPGSPLFASRILRPQDRLWLHELHPTEASLLRREFRNSPVPARVFDTDGFAGLRALLPPQPRRAVVMLDPSYELKEDYRQVVSALRDALARFAGGVYLLWYPELARRESRELPRRLRELGATNWLHARLSLRTASTVGDGLAGSGMFVINPPFTLRAALAACAGTLEELLAPDGEFALTVSG